MTSSLYSGPPEKMAGLFLVFYMALFTSGCCFSQEKNLPVDRKGLEKLGEKTALESGVTNYLDSAQVRGVVRSGTRKDSRSISPM